MQNIKVAHIIKLAVPLMLANSIVPLLGIINTMLLGHLNNATALAAIALGATIFDSLFNIFNFLRMSTTGLIAQSLQEVAQVRLIILRALCIALLLGVLLIALQQPIEALLASFIHTSPQVMQQTQTFFRANIYSAPAELIIYVITGWLIATKQTRKALYLVVLLVCVAAPLGYFFVYGAHLKTKGIALANVISTAGVAMLGLSWLQARYRLWQHKVKLSVLLNWHQLKPMLALKANVFVRTVSLVFVYSFFTFQAATFGSIILAANSVLMNLLVLLFYSLDGLANVTESFVGAAIGAKHAIKPILRNTGISCVFVAIAISLLYVVFGHALIFLITDLSSVRHQAITYLPWTYIFPLLSVWAFWLDGVFVGATKGKAMRNTMLIAALSFFAIWYLTQAWQNNGLWFSFASFMLVRMLGQCYVLRDKKFFVRKDLLS